MMKRRDALKTIGGLGAAATLSKLLPGCGGDEDDPVGIKHWVFLMMENRSYDHVFGARALQGLGGNGLRSDMTVPDHDGTPRPLYVPTPLEMCTAHDPPHGWDSSRQQFNNGANDGFLRVHPMGERDPIQYLTRDLMPVSWALADAYTTCDNWFCSVMGPTLPNRAYWHAATSLGIQNNGEILSTIAQGLTVPTIYNRLEDAGVDWAYYFGSLSVVGIMHDKGPYALDLGPTDGTGKIRRFGDAFEGDGQFFQDCADGKLPTVTYIDPAFYQNDDHPPVHPILGQELIASIYTAIAQSKLWKNTMLVITYDEHGGFYDHVPPPMVTDDTLAKYGVPGFDQLGFRVPAMVIGPYAKQGYVSNVRYDHTSALKHLQVEFGLEPLNVRMDMANDLMDCIDLDRLAAGAWAPPVPIEMPDRYAWPTTDQRCMSNEGFKLLDPISVWADENPGAFKPEWDLRGRFNNGSLIRDYLRQRQAYWKKG